MPEVDYVILCDYARIENGVAFISAAGINRFRISDLEQTQRFTIALNVSLSKWECDQPHQLQIVGADADGSAIFRSDGVIKTAWDEALPVGWRKSLILPFRIGQKFTSYGLYTIDVLIGGDIKANLQFQVQPPPARPDEV